MNSENQPTSSLKAYTFIPHYEMQSGMNTYQVTRNLDYVITCPVAVPTARLRAPLYLRAVTLGENPSLEWQKFKIEVVLLEGHFKSSFTGQ